MKGIILHGGAGTRLRPLTFTGPKQLIPIANKPTSQYVLEDLVDAGIMDVAIVLGNVYPDKVREHYGDGSKFNAKITYIDQGEPKGIAHAVGLCERFVGGDRFVVYLGDNLLKGGIKKFVIRFENDDNLDALILLTQVKDPRKFGVAAFDDNDNLVRLVEKPEKPPSNYALAGIYFLKPVIFDIIRNLKPSWRGELEITEAIQALLNMNRRVGHDAVTGWWKDTGTSEDILEANRLVLDELKPIISGTVEDERSIQGRVYIGAASLIKRGAILRGPLVIGEGTTIDSGVYIGPYSSIGNHCVIRKGEIENSILFDGCTIDINARLVDSIIGRDSVISSSDKDAPFGKRLLIGESSRIFL